MTLLHFWTQRHLGFSIFEALAGSVVLTTFAGFFSGLLARLGRAGAAGAQRDRFLTSVVRVSLSVPFLLAASVLSFAVGSSVASVVIVAEKLSPGTALSVRADRAGDVPADGSATLGDDGRFRALRLTTLFGKAYEVRVAGFQPAVFELPPWSGLTVRLPAQMQRDPSLLIRIPFARKANLPSARLKLTEVATATELTPPGGLALEGRGAVLFGPPVAIPEDRMPRWNLELSARVESLTSRSEMLLLWDDPVTGPTALSLVPGTRLRAECFARNGQLLAAREIILTTAGFQDLILHPTALE